MIIYQQIEKKAIKNSCKIFKVRESIESMGTSVSGNQDAGYQ